MRCRAHPLCLTLAIAAAVSLSSANTQAFNASDFPWLAGQTEFKTQFANSPLPDAKFQTAFEEALQVWTTDSTFVFTADGSVAADPCVASSDNGIRFDDDDCGDGYGASTVAVQTAIFTGGQRSRSVITFNSAVNWDVYGGPRQAGVTDLRRVAVHELGHSLGLGHESGQAAIMQPFVSDIERPTVDDQNGVASMYDLDADGFGVAVDNCPDLANADQSDQDADEIGDVCDSDLDGDGAFNGVTVDQAYGTATLINSFFSFGDEAASAGWAQGLTIGLSGELTGLSLPVACQNRNNGQPSSLQVRLEGSSGGLPNGQVLDTANFPAGPSATVSGLIHIDLQADGNTATVQAGDQVAFTLTSNGTCLWQRGSGSYAGGVASFSNNGSDWFAQANRDIPFAAEVLPSALDNCPFTSNADQADSNNDGVGDVCDIDSDGIRDDLDNCPSTANSDQANLDGDAFGDECDPDADNDTVNSADDSDDLNRFVCSDLDGDLCDDCSSGVFNLNNDGADSDGNGICDLGDTDDDGDGVPDLAPDNCPRTPNPDQADSNGDGVGDACEQFCVPIIAQNQRLALICL